MITELKIYYYRNSKFFKHHLIRDCVQQTLDHIFDSLDLLVEA